MSKKLFCVVSPGRSGSTAFMEALRAHADICVPPHNGELLTPRMRPQFVRHVFERSGRSATSAAELLELYLASSGDVPYVGLKIMPLQFDNFTAFAQRDDVQFITLARRDIASLVASWFVAKRFNTFKVGSRAVVRSIKFGADWEQDVRWHIEKIMINLEVMDGLANAIRIDYEDLCRPEFANDALNAYFARKIRLDDPRAPTDAREYVENWDEFSRFVDDEVGRQRRAPLARSAA